MLIMNSKAIYFFVYIFLIEVCLFYQTLADVSEEPNADIVARGEVQSCRGCSLNRLPDVKNFIYGDLPKYSGVEFHPIPGAIPHLVLFDSEDKELYRKDLSPLSRDQCNELVKKWFKLKEEEEPEIPAVVKETRQEL